MPRVTVEAAGFLRKMFARPDGRLASGAARDETIQLSVPEGTTVAALMHRLADEHPAFAAVAFRDGTFADSVQIVVNDRLLELDGGPERRLAEGDTVLLLPPFEGGAGA